ncbi:Rcat domain-containing protein [Aspergillus lucknowensis]|uniref:RING-type domain-containing protein n=1 Tax=Aspergillus lucknowensis TaxID=176173 RepID=A0ABR4LQK8_9EURO
MSVQSHTEPMLGEEKAQYLKPSTTYLEQEKQKDLRICCLVCHERKAPEQLVELPCRHRQCVDCILEVVDHYLKGRRLFSNFCCQEVKPVEAILPLIPEHQRSAYADKIEEHKLPHHKLWYCPDPSCGKWIRPRKKLVVGSMLPRFIRLTHACPFCNMPICLSCRGCGHRGRCPPDKSREMLLALAKRRGWKRCYRCGALVEKVDGCDHVTCRCGAEICYTCGGKSPCIWNCCDHGEGSLGALILFLVMKIFGMA